MESGNLGKNQNLSRGEKTSKKWQMRETGEIDGKMYNQ